MSEDVYENRDRLQEEVYTLTAQLAKMTAENTRYKLANDYCEGKIQSLESELQAAREDAARQEKSANYWCDFAIEGDRIEYA